ncbi:MAG: M28 family metallopeptidase [Thermoleophilia bacterium]
MPGARSIAAALVLGLVLLATAACGDGSGAPSPGRFDGERAFREAAAQVAMGPRPAGSAASRRLAARIRAKLPHGRFEAVPGGLRNVVGTLPGRGKAILVGAHYDTKDIPGFVGANDGAGGTATVLELARVLRADRRACERPIRFVFFDGEETPDDLADFYSTGLRGSRAYARRHAKALAAAVIVDFVGDKDLSLPREAGSDRALWARLRAAAKRAGTLSAFPNRTVGEILDDHTPFARAGVPSIDLIDFDYPPWHTTGDTLDKISAASLDRAGEALVLFLRDLSRAPCGR